MKTDPFVTQHTSATTQALLSHLLTLASSQTELVVCHHVDTASTLFDTYIISGGVGGLSPCRH